MGSTGAYRVNEPTVIHQTIGGETVIIHLANGLYYSLQGSGAEIWERFSDGGTVDEASAALSEPSGTDRDQVTAEISAFVGRLVDEDLLVPVTAEDLAVHQHGAASALPVAETETPTRRQFETPRVARYDDLQDLLLLDPIHAVDDTGWPQRPQPSAGVAGDG